MSHEYIHGLIFHFTEGQGSFQLPDNAGRSSIWLGQRSWLTRVPRDRPVPAVRPFHVAVLFLVTLRFVTVSPFAQEFAFPSLGNVL